MSISPSYEKKMNERITKEKNERIIEDYERLKEVEKKYEKILTFLADKGCPSDFDLKDQIEVYCNTGVENRICRRCWENAINN